MVHHLATDISRADLRAAAVSMTPAAVYGFERTVGLRPDVDPGAYQGFFHWVKGGWFAIEVTTIVTGAIAWRLVPFSFVALPIALTAWFMSMDAAPLLIDSPDRADRGLISVVVGLLILGAAFALRRRQRADLNYWLGGGWYSMPCGISSSWLSACWCAHGCSPPSAAWPSRPGSATWPTGSLRTPWSSLS